MRLMLVRISSYLVIRRARAYCQESIEEIGRSSLLSDYPSLVFILPQRSFMHCPCRAFYELVELDRLSDGQAFERGGGDLVLPRAPWMCKWVYPCMLFLNDYYDIPAF